MIVHIAFIDFNFHFRLEKRCVDCCGGGKCIGSLSSQHERLIIAPSNPIIKQISCPADVEHVPAIPWSNPIYEVLPFGYSLVMV